MNTQSTAHFNGQVAFIDAGVFDPASISSHFQRGTEIHLLNSSQDGIDQITQFLAGRSDIKAVQIVSHGHDGELQLGNTDVTDLSAYDHDLQLWSKALSTDADILLGQTHTKVHISISTNFGRFIANGLINQSLLRKRLTALALCKSGLCYS